MTNSKILSKLPADSKNTIINGPLVNVLDAKYVRHIKNENHDKRPMLIPDSIKPNFKDIWKVCYISTVKSLLIKMLIQ